jgi:predicted site-specific integrase-resolvase
MKLSEYARRNNIRYLAAYKMWQKGLLEGHRLPTGTIVIHDSMPTADAPTKTSSGVALYARVSGDDQAAEYCRRDAAQRQLQRLRDYAAARGYMVATEVVEIASGLNDQRPKLTRLLADKQIGTLLVEHKDRLTRFGFHYIEKLLANQGRRIEVINQSDTQDELVDDFVAVITSMAARIYGRRSSKQRVKAIREAVEQAYGQGE